MTKKTTEKQLFDKHQKLRQLLKDQPLLLQGSVIDVKPKSKDAKTSFIWTRKVSGKTVTKALSKPQALAFREAIQQNREISQLIKDITKLSEAHILATVEGVKTKARRTS